MSSRPPATLSAFAHAVIALAAALTFGTVAQLDARWSPLFSEQFGPILGPQFALAADDFERSVEPLLSKHCRDCHGATKQEGDLRVDRLARDPSNPQAAGRWRDLADRIRSGEMPPKDRPRLTTAESKTILDWIDRQVAAGPGVGADGSGASHWAFQPPRDASPPQVVARNWPRDAVDQFILARLEVAEPRRGLTPSPEADRPTLLRRVSLDLLGLPPTPEEIDAFVEDRSPDAWERVVDRLLASPHYGERWGRHWLDLAQYADSSGFHNDLDRPHAWKYRDYVIASFNADKPYARFVAEQLAGDEVDGANEETYIATGFCRNGPSNDDNMGKTPEALAQYRADQLDNVVSTTGAVFLGLTIGCARCHNHKTEPLTSRDYYSLVAVFNGTQKHGLVPGTEDTTGKKVAVDPAVQIQALVERSSKVAPTYLLRRGLVANRGEEVGPAVPAVLTREPVVFPPPESKANSSLRRRTVAEWIGAPDNPLTWRVLANRVWRHHFGAGIVTTPSNFGVGGERPSHPELLDWLARRLATDGGQIKPLHRRLVTSATYRQSSQHRADAAAVDPTNRLLWRANLRRLEAEPLRDGILAASGNLNRRAGGPGIKPRIRAELLTASQRNKWPVIAQENHEHWRRSVYIYAKRQLLMPLMELFDAPTTTDSCAVRLTSVVPTQALILMNDEFVEEQAAHLAARAIREVRDESESEPQSKVAPGSDAMLESVVRRMFRLAVSREPDSDRLREAVDFVQRQAAGSERNAALADLAHVLFNSSDFMYVR